MSDVDENISDDSVDDIYDEDGDSDEGVFTLTSSQSTLLLQLEENENNTTGDEDKKINDTTSKEDSSKDIKSDWISPRKALSPRVNVSFSPRNQQTNDDKSNISLEKEDISKPSGISLEKDNIETEDEINNDKEQSSFSISVEKDDSPEIINNENNKSNISLEKELQEESNENNTEEEEEEEKKEETMSKISLRDELRSKKALKRDFVSINLGTLSALAVADIKRFSLSSTSIVEVEVAKGRHIHPVKSGPPSPIVLLAIRKESCKDHEKKIDIKKPHEETSVLSRNSSPAWNEKKEIILDQITGEKKFLVVEVRDKSPKGEFLGYFELNLNNIADLVPREEWFNLQRRRKKDKATGQILLRTKIRPERAVEETVVIRNENFPTIPSFIYNSYWNQHCVKQLSITNCNISSIPEGLSSLGSLEVLQLADNDIATIPKTLGRIFTLKCLDISNNRISKLPQELSNLKNLQLLNISKNKFCEDNVPPCIIDLDLWCDISGKPDKWEQLIEDELIKRENNTNNEEGDKFIMDEKEKEIQRLLQNMK